MYVGLRFWLVGLFMWRSYLVFTLKLLFSIFKFALFIEITEASVGNLFQGLIDFSSNFRAAKWYKTIVPDQFINTDVKDEMVYEQGSWVVMIRDEHYASTRNLCSDLLFFFNMY